MLYILKLIIKNNHPSIEERIAFMYQEAKYDGNATEFIDYLISKGITIINDVEKDFYYDSNMCGYKLSESDLDNFLFNPDSKIVFETLSDKELDKITSYRKDEYDVVEVFY